MKHSKIKGLNVLMKKLGLLFFTTLLCSSATLAQEKNHSIFASMGIGSVNYDLDRTDEGAVGSMISDDDVNTIAQFGYRYQYTDSIGMEVKYSNANSSGLDFTYTDLDFSFFTVAGVLRTELAQNQFIYASLGANYYDWTVEDKKRSGKLVFKENQSGVDIYYAVGYKYEFSSIEIGIEYQIIKMADMDSNIGSITLGYRF
ncbi:MAG: hypothetical protein ACI9LM_004832 [Alteromonadaceae bacterium]|jgi:hypothetical protein